MCGHATVHEAQVGHGIAIQLQTEAAAILKTIASVYAPLEYDTPEIPDEGQLPDAIASLWSDVYAAAGDGRKAASLLWLNRIAR